MRFIRRIAILFVLAILAGIGSFVLPIRAMYQPAVATAFFVVLMFVFHVPSLGGAVVFGLSFLILIPIVFSLAMMQHFKFSEIMQESVRVIFSRTDIVVAMLLPMVVATVTYVMVSYLFRSKD